MSGTEGNLTYSANVNGYTTEGYRDRSKTEAFGVGVTLSHPLCDKSDLDLTLSWQDVSYELPGYLTREQMQADPRQSTNPDDSAEDSYITGALRLKTAHSDSMLSTIDLAMTRKDVTGNIPSWFSFSDVTIDSLAVTPRLELTGELMGLGNKLLLGLDAYIDTLKQDRFMDAVHSMTTGGAEVEKTTIGLYVRDEAALSDELLLALGARVEWANIDAEAWSGGATTVNDDVDHDASAFDLSLTHLINDTSKLYARVATLYRYPFVDEQVSFYGWGDAIYTSLKPEEGVSAEIGTHVDLAKGWISAALFGLEMQDEISYNGFTFQNENLDDTRRYGAEIAGRWSLGRVVLGADYSYTDAAFVAGPNDGKDVPLVPHHKGSVSADVMLPAGVALDVIATYVGESYLGGDYGNIGPKLSDYTVVDLFLTYRPSSTGTMELYAGVQNLFDEDYASVGYKGFSADGYYPSAGVNYQAGLRYTF